MMNLTPEERAAGQANFAEVTRRDFLKAGVAAGVVAGGGLGAFYFGYEKAIGSPVRVGVIGTGDEGSVLLGAINPKFIEVRAIADIRPYNVYRAFYGDYASDAELSSPAGADGQVRLEDQRRGRQARQGLRPLPGIDRQRQAATRSKR